MISKSRTKRVLSQAGRTAGLKRPLSVFPILNQLRQRSSYGTCLVVLDPKDLFPTLEFILYAAHSYVSSNRSVLVTHWRWKPCLPSISEILLSQSGCYLWTFPQPLRQRTPSLIFRHMTFYLWLIASQTDACQMNKIERKWWEEQKKKKSKKEGWVPGIGKAKKAQPLSYGF